MLERTTNQDYVHGCLDAPVLGAICVMEHSYQDVLRKCLSHFDNGTYVMSQIEIGLSNKVQGCMAISVYEENEFK